MKRRQKKTQTGLLNCENQLSRAPTLLELSGRQHRGKRHVREFPSGSARSENLSMRRNLWSGNQEVPPTPGGDGPTGRADEATNRDTAMHAGGKSDNRVVPTKRLNNGGSSEPLAEAVEERRLTEGNAQQTTTLRTQSRIGVSLGLLRVREAARRDKCARFTNLLHHVTLDLLRQSFCALKREAAPGVDGVTWRKYEANLELQLRDLHDRVHRGAYRAQPSRRTYIPKADGKQRPLGIAALEDKIVQHAVATVLNHIYEEDFLGFSYGFRPGRHQHHALDALWVGVMDRKVRWVLDADIRGFFDTIDHEWMLKFVEHRIADPRILRLIRKWLKAGVSEDGRWTETTVGIPQGAVISPLLANVYLHYVFDLWVNLWRRKYATGDIIVVRYADDFVLGFQYHKDAERFLAELRERMANFGLALHPDKTRLIQFGRFAASNRRQQGKGKPETFNFLGFTHLCSETRRTKEFTILRYTMSKRMKATLKAIRASLVRRRHDPLGQTALWLASVLRGYYQYHAVPGNYGRLRMFWQLLKRIWFRTLSRRSQRARLQWEHFGPLADQWLPPPRILHPYPNVRFYAIHPK